jgi:polysaccharide export outer membrane protein
VDLPIAGIIRLSGMTADEAAIAVEKKLRNDDILTYPHVNVFIAEYATQGVTVTGEVKTPGIYPLLGSHGLVDLISAAGGVTSTASKSVTIVHKSDPSHPETVQLSTKAGVVSADPDIRPGDTVTVARAGVVYVVGDVGKPGGFLIEANDRLTAVQALALAAGANRTALQDKARLIRKTPNGREEVPVPLNKIIAGKTIDVPLEDGDILFVPGSERKNLALRSVEAAINVAAGLIIYDTRF